jgi:hypothetical protein
MKLAKRIAAAGFFVCAFTALSRGTTLARMDLRELALSAELVVRARCAGTEVRAERGAIWTFAKFEVIETLKGSTQLGLIEVRLPGGQLGHVREIVEGVPKFSGGEEVALCLERTTAGDFGITGWAQGTFRVRRGAADSEANVTQDSSGFGVFDARTRQFTTIGIRKMPLSVFRTQIASALAPFEKRQTR